MSIKRDFKYLLLALSISLKFYCSFVRCVYVYTECVDGRVLCARHSVCRGQRITVWGRFSPSAFMWDPESN